MMKRLLMILSMMLVPMTIAAQEKMAQDKDRSDEPANARSISPDDFVDTTVQPQPVAVPPKAAAFRRRGSMVGYIEDATVETAVRIRFETAFHNDFPDRAEFFYAKCGCYRDLATANPAYDPNAPGPRPGAVTDLNFQQLYFQGQYAFSNRASAFAELPLRWIQPQTFLGGGTGFASQGGVSDLRAGVKLALVSSPEQIVTAQVKAYFPTGDAGRGLGTNHVSFEPVVLYTRAADRFLLESEFGFWLPAGGAAPNPTSTSGNFSGNILMYGIGPSYELYSRNGIRFAPVVELVGWSVLSGYQTGATSDASGTNIVNIKIGARASFDPHGSIYVGYGHALTSASWYDDIVRFEYRYSF
jgi:hypothetical protein